MRGRTLAGRPSRGSVIHLGLFIALILVVAAYPGPIQAGPCTGEIDRLQAQLDARIDAEASQGRAARESRSALEHHQPTPESILEAEDGLGEGAALGHTSVALARARVADSHGDARACEEALARARRALQR